MSIKENALDYLMEDRVLYMGMISSINRGTANILYTGKDGVCIRETASDVYMIALNNFIKGKELADKLGKQSQLCVYHKDISV